MHKQFTIGDYNFENLNFEQVDKFSGESLDRDVYRCEGYYAEICKVPIERYMDDDW